MKRMHLLIPLLVLAFQLSTAWGDDNSMGNDHGNGGGVICLSGKCSTLIDAGLVMNPEYPDFWIPSNGVLGEINRLISQYPFPLGVRNSIRQRILQKMTHFKAVKVVDQQKIDQVLNIYKDTLKKEDPKFDFSNFQIVAISSDDTAKEQNTFLLPDFFSLDEATQAKMLIHEGFYRGQPSKMLRYVLQLESALKAFEQFAGTIAAFRYQLVSAQIAAYNLGIINVAQVFNYVMYWTYTFVDPKYYRSPGSSLSCEDCNGIFQFIPGSQAPGHTSPATVVVDSDEVQRRSGLDSRTAVMLLNLDPIVVEDTQHYCGTFGSIGYTEESTPGLYIKNCKVADPLKLKLLLPK